MWVSAKGLRKKPHEPPDKGVSPALLGEDFGLPLGKWGISRQWDVGSTIQPRIGKLSAGERSQAKPLLRQLFVGGPHMLLHSHQRSCALLSGEEEASANYFCQPAALSQETEI